MVWRFPLQSASSKAHPNRSAMGKKAVLVFDEKARKEFITGFHKRKVERRQKARQRIAEEVRQEKIQERKEKREQLKGLRGIGLGEALGEPAAAASSGAKSRAPAAAAAPPPAAPLDEVAYDFQGMTATTVVESLEPEPEPEPRPRGRPAEQRGTSAPRPKEKKFNLDQPLATAIPGYKSKLAAGARRKKKEGKAKRRGPVGKKEKAKNRAAGRAARRSETRGGR